MEFSYQICPLCGRAYVINPFSPVIDPIIYELPDGHEVTFICEDCRYRYRLYQTTCQFCGTPMYAQSDRPICHECVRVHNDEIRWRARAIKIGGGIFFLVMAIAGLFAFGLRKPYWILLGLVLAGIFSYLLSNWILDKIFYKLPAFLQGDFFKFVFDIFINLTSGVLLAGSIFYLLSGGEIRALFLGIWGWENLGELLLIGGVVIVIIIDYVLPAFKWLYKRSLTLARICRRTLAWLGKSFNSLFRTGVKRFSSSINSNIISKYKTYINSKKIDPDLQRRLRKVQERDVERQRREKMQQRRKEAEEAQARKRVPKARKEASGGARPRQRDKGERVKRRR